MFETGLPNLSGQNVPVLYRKPRRRIDRKLVAKLLAEGRPVSEVAETVGCARQHIWRLMRSSVRFNEAMDDAAYEVGRDADGRLEGLRPDVVDAIKRELDAGNVRVLLWLAERLELGIGIYGNSR
jgi:hypothetical protein